MSEQLGRAELELGADLAPLDRDLARAERRVALSVAAMQKTLDSLHADADINILAEALATGPVSSAVSRSVEPIIVQQRAPAAPTRSTEAEQVWGIRGPRMAGSLTNPIVTVLAASKLFPMGSYGAAVGEDNASDVQRGDQSSGVASAAELAALTAAVQDLASNITPGNQLAAAGAQGVAEPGGPQRSVVALDAANGDALSRAATALESASVSLASSSSNGGTAPAPMDAELLALLRQYRTPPQVSSSRATTVIDEHPGSRVFVAGPGGGGSRTVVSGPAGTSTVSLDGGQYAGLISAIMETGLGGGGGGGGGLPVAVGGGGGRDGGTGLLGRLGWGGGIAGMAAIGSALSFAGLGFEHILTTIMGLVGSATAAAGGGGLLALGSLGKVGVGAGSDLLVSKAAVSNAKSVFQAQEKLNQAIAVYGKGSKQAVTAQKELNYTLSQMAPTVAQASKSLATQATALQDYFQSATAGAQVTADKIFSQWLGVARTFTPLIGQAAQQNLTVINQGLQPLFAWLQGPQGIGIFHQLEDAFASTLPTAIHALDQGLELFLRVMSIASQNTGGFVTHLDALLTRWNSLSNAQISAVVQKYVNDFHLWDRFVKLLITDIYLLFHQDVGTGNSIIQALTGMLQKLHEYETSAHGQAQIQNIFEVHKTEILALLKLLPELGSAFGHVYLAIAPGAVTVLNDVVLPVINALAQALADLAKASPLAADGLGALLIGAKFGGWTAIMAQLTKVRALLFGTAAAEAAAAGGTAAVAGGAARAGTTVSTGAGLLEKGGFSLGAFLAGRGFAGAGVTAANIATLLTSALKTGLAGIGGFIAGDIARSLAGIGHGGQSGTGSLAGTVIGGALLSWTGPLGTAIGATAGNIIGGVIGSLVGRGTVQTTLTGQSAAGSRIDSRLASQLQPGDIVHIKEIGNFAHWSMQQIQGLLTVLKPGIKVTVNGVPESEKQVRQLAQRTLDAKQKIQQATMGVVTDMHFLFSKSGQTLSSLQDDFNTTMRHIAYVLGINSKQGRLAVEENINLMWQRVMQGMDSGKINVALGMAALDQILKTGVKDGAITFEQQFFGMFDTVTNLYRHNKISSTQYFADLAGITTQGWRNINAQVRQETNQQKQWLAAAYHDGIITKKGYQNALHVLQVQANQQEQQDMQQWIGNMLSAMIGSGRTTYKGMLAIVNELNPVLKKLGATPITAPTLYNITGGTGATSMRGSGFGATAATGALVQVGQPGEAGRDSVPLNVGGYPIMVAPGEQVAVFNRHQLPIVNAALAGYGGLPGLFQQVSRPNYMAEGGLVPGFTTGGPLAGGAFGSPYSGYAMPWPKGMTPSSSTWSQDQGVDVPIGAGTPEFAIGPGSITAEGIGGFGPNAPVLGIDQGPLAGRHVYYGHAGPDTVGTGASVSAGQQISEVGAGIVGISTGPHIEIGFSDASGNPVPGTSGEMYSLLLQLLSGAGVSGIGGAGGGGGPSVAAKVWKALTAPGVKGSGALADIVRGALAKLTGASNAYGQKAVAKWNATHGAVSGAGVAPGSWTQVASQLAARHGWGSSEVQAWLGVEHLEDGSFSLTAQNSSGAYGLAQFINGPGEYAQYGGNASTLVGQLTAMANYIAQRYGTPSAALAHENAFHWYGHGGMIPGFAAGGLQPGPVTDPIDSKTGRPIPKRFLGHHHPHRRSVPTDRRRNRNSGGVGLPNLPKGAEDLDRIHDHMHHLDRILGPASHDPLGATYLNELLGYWPGIWALQNPTATAIMGDPTQAVITTDPKTGLPVSPYLDTKDIDVAKRFLEQQIDWEARIVGDYRSGVGMSGSTAGMIRRAIERRKDEIAKLTRRLRENLKRIAELKKKVAANQRLITKEQAKGSKANRPRIEGWKDQNAHWTAHIQQLGADNHRIAGGSVSSIGSVTGGRIGKLNSHVAGLENALALVTGSGQYSPNTLQGVTGVGGLLGPAVTNLRTLEKELGALDPQALQRTLQKVDASTSPIGQSNPLTGTVAFSYEGQSYLGSLAGGVPGMAGGGMVDMGALLNHQTDRFAQMARLPEFAGTFHTGGVIPGVPGTEKLALVQSGETITPIGGRGGDMSAIRDLTAALRENESTLRANTSAMCDNTRGMRMSYSRGTGSLASDRISYLHVGA